MEIYAFTILVEMSTHFSTRALTSDHRFHFYTSYFRTISRDSIRLTDMIRGPIDQHGESIFFYSKECARLIHQWCFFNFTVKPFWMTNQRPSVCSSALELAREI